MIFLYGSPRSGTTWLGKILDSHPDTLLRHEPDTIIRGEYPFISDELFVDEAREHIAAMVRCRDPKVTGTRPVFHKSYLLPLAWALKYASVYGVKALERVLPKSILPDIPDLVGDKNYEIIIKTVSMLGRLRSIYSAYPDAQYIHIVRHPCGHVNSVLKGWRKGLLPGSAFFGFVDLPVGQKYGLTRERLESMDSIGQIAWRWAILNESAMLNVPSHKFIAYDHFCEHPMKATEGLLESLGLGWHEQVERYIAYSGQNKNGFFDTRRDPNIAANKWKENFEGASKVIAAIEHTEIYKQFIEFAQFQQS